MKLLSSRWLVALLIILILISAACGPSGRTADNDDAEATTPATVAEVADAAPPSLAEGDSITTPSGLQYIEIESGGGPMPQRGDTVFVHYTGTLEDGTEFDSSLTTGQPYQFALGQGAVIPGWDEGIALMREGGKAQLIIPPELAYGPSGSGPIPPDATLFFDVELVEVKPMPQLTEVDEADYTTTASGLKYHVLEAGDGDTPQSGDLVSVHFNLWLDDGTFLDSTIDRGAPYSFILDSEGSLMGLNEGLLLLKEGGQAQLIVPPELTDGSGATYVFELELLETQAPPTPAVVAEADYIETESGLKYYIIQEGNGNTPQAGDLISLHYTLWLEDGTMIDSSIQRGAPLEIPVGAGGTIPGFEEGLLLVEEGGKAQIVVPPELGYGEAGGGPIPPDANLIFEIEIVAIQTGP